MLPSRHFFKSGPKWAVGVLAESLAYPLLAAAAKWMVSKPSTPSKEWRRGILLGADHIGDVLYRTSSLAKLRQILPDCSWDWAVRPPSDEILKENPHVGEIIKIDPLWSSSEIARCLQMRNYDVAICYDTGAYEKSLSICLQAKIPNRIGYIHKGLSAWVTHPVQIVFPQTYPAYFRDLVASFANTTEKWDLRPKVFTTAEDENEANNFLFRHGLHSAREIVACFITSRQPTSSVWPEESFLAVMNNILSESDAKLILLGAASEHEKLNAFSHRLGGNILVAAGELKLRALVCFLRKCRAVLTTDSGPRHLSNAAQTPPVFVRNPLFLPEEAGVYCEDEYDCADFSSSSQVSQVTTTIRKLISDPS